VEFEGEFNFVNYGSYLSPTSRQLDAPHTSTGDPAFSRERLFLPRPILSLNVVDPATLLDSDLAAFEQELSFSSNDFCGQEPSYVEKDIELYYSQSP
jgi:hypothetical protein